MQSSLKDKVVMVVGADTRPGDAITRRLADRGARLAPVNGAESDAAGCVERALGQFGAIHALVVALPDGPGLGLDGLTDGGFSQVLSDGLAVPFAFIRAVVPGMRKQGYGRVVTLSSLRYLGLPGGADIAAAQSGIFGLTRSLALEYARDRITFNTVVKGDLSTPEQTEEDVAKISAGIPAKRLATPDDIAYAVDYFASDASQYVTGQTFFVCGGKSAYFSMSV